MKADFQNDFLLKGKRSLRRGVYLSHCTLLSVALLNIFLIASCVFVATLWRGTSFETQRSARQFAGAGTDRQPSDRDPEPPHITPRGPSGEQCCRSLNQNVLRQICSELSSTTQTEASTTSQKGKRMTPAPTTISTTTSPTAATTKYSNRSTSANSRSTPSASTPVTTRESPMDDDNAIDNLRLPRHLRPYHYNIWWRPDFYQTSPDDFSLRGAVDVFFRCHSSTSTVSLNVRSLVIDRSSIKVTSLLDNRPVAWTDAKEDTIAEVFNLTLGRPLATGEEIIVTMNFTGLIDYRTQGVYWSEYSTLNGTRFLVSSQMQTTEARRAFPCVDDPAAKATFTLSIDRQTHVFALANTPLNFTTSSQRDSVWVTDVFQATKTMSTYLVAFIVSDFTGIGVTSNGSSHTSIGLWAQDNYKTAGYLNYVSVVAPKFLDFFEDYFNYSYKWPKLDMVAAPKLTFGGMENWGLIMYQVNLFLLDEKQSDTEEKQNVAGIIAHEILHNWLGNTVTIRWWDDLWLAEGMARYFQYEALQTMHSNSDIEQLFVHQVFYTKAMWNDDSGSSTPVYNPVLYTNSDLDNMFNGMVYDKGASIIRMLSKLIVGEEVFQEALRMYVSDHQYDNVDHSDLFNALTQAYLNSGKRLDFDVKDVISTWIMQQGYPLVTVTRKSSNELILTQKWYLYKLNNNTIDETYPSPYRYLWEIPVTFITSFDSSPVMVWMHKVDNANVQLTSPLSDNQWILVNYNLYGYYRVNYDDRNWRLLATQLNSDHTKVPLINRAQLIDDSYTLSMSGNLTQVTGLKLSEYLTKETEYLPWKLFQENIAPLLRQFSTDDQFFSRLQSFVLSRLQNNYNRLGWDGRADDNITVTFLRRLILELACQADSSPCVSEALNRFRLWQVNGFNSTLLSPDNHRAVYCTAAARGNHDDWQLLLSRYQAARSDFTAESEKLAEALTCTRNATTIKRLLEAVQQQDSSVVATADYYNVVWYIARSRYSYNTTWEHLYKYGANTFGRVDIVRALATVISTKTEADRLDVYLSNYPASNDYEKESFSSYRETIRQNIDWRQQNERQISDWLTDLSF